ncbi:MAG: arsenite efflux transporter metallochaperone ArsD [bacterium]
MKNVEVFAPPMCCANGICGPKVDPALTRCAADLFRLKNQGIAITRYNLAKQPLAFEHNETVRAAMSDDDTCLPLVLVGGKIVSRGKYPLREELVEYAGVTAEARGASGDDEEWCDAVAGYNRVKHND